MKIRDVVVTALLGAVLLVAQVALSFLPNVELVSLLVMLYAMEFPPRVAFGSVYVFALLEGLCYGFGSWWPGYLYIWAVAALAAYLLRRTDSALFWAVGGAAYAFSWWVSGLPFDLLHCAGNFVAMLLLYRPLRRCFAPLARHSFPSGRIAP